MAKYTQAFAFDVPAPADQALAAVKRAVEEMDGGHLGSVDEGARTVIFSTGISTTSWGEELQAVVHEASTGSRVEVQGKPKGTFLTTKWGEEIHANRIEKKLREGIDAALA